VQRQGIAVDVPVRSTLAGLRAGEDEVLATAHACLAAPAALATAR
jgi:hypothetical protein